MSIHRRICVSVAPSLVSRHSLTPAPDGHTHACVHDAEPWLEDEPLEHQCACGMTWTESAHPLPSRRAPDTSWITIEEQRGPGIWPLVAPLAIATLIAAAIIWAAGL